MHAGTHVRARVCNELVIKMLTICKKINPLTPGVRAAGGLKKSFETYFPVNSPNWEHGPTLTDFIFIKIVKGVNSLFRVCSFLTSKL